MLTSTQSPRQDLVNELRFSDFPHEVVGQEYLDKYTIRAWLIGYAVLHGWHYDPIDELSGQLRKSETSVLIQLVLGGVMIDDELIETLS